MSVVLELTENNDDIHTMHSPLRSNRHHRSNGDCLEGKRKIIRSVLCNIVCNNCAQCNTQTYEQT